MPKAQGVDIGHEVEKIGEEDEQEEEEIAPVAEKTKKEIAKEYAEKAKNFVIEAFRSTEKIRDQNLI